MRYAVVKPDGSHEVFETKGRLSLETLQQKVAAPKEGHATIEAVRAENVTIYMNENGKYLPLATNVVTTLYARDKRMISPHDAIKGDCVIVGEPDDEGYDLDVHDEVLAEILRYNR